ncbi:hypothetical protein Lal_00036441 [Lupinus albus]|nr:hypothetical protein Lal_00036441 [Lupinus albus]
MSFVNDFILIRDSKEKLNWKLDRKNIECEFNKRRTNATIEIKLRDHIMSRVTRFKYFWSIIHMMKKLREI